jgi:solute carrier family 25 ornithine transporter 2/15
MVINCHYPSFDSALPVTIAAGGFGGICLWTLIFPFDVCKSKIQVESLRDPMHRVLRQIVRQHGFGALYNGLWPTLLRTFPSTGALFVAYEYGKQYLEFGADHLLL